MNHELSEKMAADPAYRELFATSHHRRVVRQQVVIAEGATPTSLYMILSGTVAVQTVDVQSNELLLGYFYPGDFFGEMGLFPDVASRSAEIRACSDSLLLEIDYGRFLELTARHSKLWIDLAGQLAARLRAVNRRLAEMPTLHAADRIWLVLRELALRSEAPRLNDGRQLRITRQDLGRLAGCTRELAGMVLHDFEVAGRVVLSGHAIIVRESALAMESPALCKAADGVLRMSTTTAG